MRIFNYNKLNKPIMMIIVECIDPGVWKNHLTLGSKYNVIALDEDVYQLIDDSGEINYYFINRFNKLKQD